MRGARLRAIGAGLLIAAAVPPWGWWPLGLLGLRLWYRLIDIEGARTRFTRSLLVGAFWAFPATLWMFDLTAAGWPVAAGLFTLLVGAAGAITPSRTRAQPPAGTVGARGAPGRERPIVFVAAVVAVELIRWHVPFGGVPIATLAMASVATPWAGTARVLGSPFLVAVTVMIAVALAEAVRRPRVAFLLGCAVVASAVAGNLASRTVETNGEIAVAVVQGGGPQNTRADVCENRNVFERHMAASAQISDEPVDLILWPEDVVHVSPDGTPTPSRCDQPIITRSEALRRLTDLAVEREATLITGWFERAEDGLANVNYSIVIDADGELGDRYDKVRLVPFGEFVPLRGLIEQFSDELPGLDVRPGTGPAVLETDVGPLGISISWEVFFDYRARDAINNGGEVLLNPTNGSSYWLTIVQSQQVASSRLRALETDRWVLQAAPTGFSAIVGPDGAVEQRTGVSEQAVLRQTIERRTGRTPAVVFGPWPMIAAIVAVLGWSMFGPGGRFGRSVRPRPAA